MFLNYCITTQVSVSSLETLHDKEYLEAVIGNLAYQILEGVFLNFTIKKTRRLKMYLDWQYHYLLRGIIKEGCALPFILLIVQNNN
jgi:hypothetical protein